MAVPGMVPMPSNAFMLCYFTAFQCLVTALSSPMPLLRLLHILRTSIDFCFLVNSTGRSATSAQPPPPPGAAPVLNGVHVKDLGGQFSPLLYLDALMEVTPVSNIHFPGCFSRLVSLPVSLRGTTVIQKLLMCHAADPALLGVGQMRCFGAALAAVREHEQF